jgi:hypothetical protein
MEGREMKEWNCVIENGESWVRVAGEEEEGNSVCMNASVYDRQVCREKEKEREYAWSFVEAFSD